ncbi:hypothetical protein PG994_000628 [Apiospora phragmitis]|uniref:Uncharacterized protein n=1 Tax=Apiospora phragmitis TaxID=2905665 RepID=A0ABR1X6U1_9PEZI
MRVSNPTSRYLTALAVTGFLARTASAVCTNWTQDGTVIYRPGHNTIMFQQTLDRIECPGTPRRTIWVENHAISLPQEESDAVLALASAGFFRARPGLAYGNTGAAPTNDEANVRLDDNEFTPLRFHVDTADAREDQEGAARLSRDLFSAAPGANHTFNFAPDMVGSKGTLGRCSNESLDGLQVWVYAPYTRRDSSRYHANRTYVSGTFGWRETALKNDTSGAGSLIAGNRGLSAWASLATTIAVVLAFA